MISDSDYFSDSWPADPPHYIVERGIARRLQVAKERFAAKGQKTARWRHRVYPVIETVSRNDTLWHKIDISTVAGKHAWLYIRVDPLIMRLPAEMAAAVNHTLGVKIEAA